MVAEKTKPTYLLSALISGHVQRWNLQESLLWHGAGRELSTLWMGLWLSGINVGLWHSDLLCATSIWHFRRRWCRELWWHLVDRSSRCCTNFLDLMNPGLYWMLGWTLGASRVCCVTADHTICWHWRCCIMLFCAHRITSRARHLLNLIPTDPSIQDALDSLGQKVGLSTIANSLCIFVFLLLLMEYTLLNAVLQGLRQGSPEAVPRSPKASPRSSPRKFVPGPTPSSTSAYARSTPKELLRSLFDATAENMSTFRVLYNLEVRGWKYMETSCSKTDGAIT